MNLFDPVETIMSSQLITVSQNDPIGLLVEIFKKNKFHHILVVQEMELIGIVSRDDLIYFLTKDMKESKQQKRLQKHTVSEIMITQIATLEPDDKITVALEVFKRNILRALPVVIDKVPVGIVTPYDIIKKLSEDQRAESTYNL